MLSLENFVSESLKQIVTGIVSAQSHAREHGARVNPSQLARGKMNENIYLDNHLGVYAQMINFDIAVTAVESSESGSGASIGIPVLRAGVQGTRGEENTTVSRISFQVPVSLPPQHIDADPGC